MARAQHVSSVKNRLVARAFVLDLTTITPLFVCPHTNMAEAFAIPAAKTAIISGSHHRGAHIARKVVP
jgi:hypothetical protein